MSLHFADEVLFVEEALLDALIDSLKLLPFLAGVYVLIEILEHKTS